MPTLFFRQVQRIWGLCYGLIWLVRLPTDFINNLIQRIITELDDISLLIHIAVLFALHRVMMTVAIFMTRPRNSITVFSNNGVAVMKQCRPHELWLDAYFHL